MCDFPSTSVRWPCVSCNYYLGRLGNSEDSDWLCRRSDLEAVICTKHSDPDQTCSLGVPECVKAPPAGHRGAAMARLRQELKLPVCTRFRILCFDLPVNLNCSKCDHAAGRTVSLN